MRDVFNGAIGGAALFVLCAVPALAGPNDGAEAIRTHVLCVLRNAAKLDDGRMSPFELAKQVQPLCHAEHEAAALATMPEKWANTPPDQAREVEFDHTVAVVELYRQRR